MEVLERNPRDMDRCTAEIEEMEETLCDSIRDALRNKQAKEGGDVARKRSRVKQEDDGRKPPHDLTFVLPTPPFFFLGSATT